MKSGDVPLLCWLYLVMLVDQRVYQILMGMSIYIYYILYYIILLYIIYTIYTIYYIYYWIWLCFWTSSFSPQWLPSSDLRFTKPFAGLSRGNRLTTRIALSFIKPDNAVILVIGKDPDRCSATAQGWGHESHEKVITEYTIMINNIYIYLYTVHFISYSISYHY